VTGYFFALALSLTVILFLVNLMRKRRLREKYAILWIVLAALVIIIGAFPELVIALTRLVGVELPVNLVFAVALVFLLIVCIHLSTEITAIEEKTRTLTEELALLRLATTKDLPQKLGAGESSQPAVEDLSV